MANLNGLLRRLLSKPISRILISKPSTRCLFTTTPSIYSPRTRLSLPAISHSFSLHYHKISQSLILGGPRYAGWIHLSKNQLEDCLAKGIDYGHYVVETYKPEGDLSRDELINHYVHTLARVLGSEEEARMRIYSVSTRHYYAFSAHLCGETARQLFDLPGVHSVRADLIEGEPFVDGKAFPYDPRHQKGYLKSLHEAEDKTAEGFPKGCDFNHWIVYMKEDKYKHLSRDEIINSYIKTLVPLCGSEEKARMMIYSVSTRFYFSFSVNVTELYEPALNYLPNVDYVLPDSYIDVENRTYRGEPFINGKAVPYDPKYHKEFC